MENSKNQNQEPITDAKVLGIPKTMLLGLQHLFAMFGATVLVPVISGLNVSATLLFAGVGTLLFHKITKKIVPAFLGSSFAFLTGYATIRGICNNSDHWVSYACLGVFVAGLVYVLISYLIKKFGSETVLKFFPPVVTGPVIIAIGLNLSANAIEKCGENILLALIAIIVIIIANIYGKGIVKIVPIFLGIFVSYIFALVTGQIDTAPIANAAWIGLPIKYNDTVFSIFNNFDASIIPSTLLTMVPIALVTIVEHVGNICAISSTIGKDLIKYPGVNKTLLGDGLATSLAALFGAPANTTYGENTGVLAISKVYDPKVIRIAAVFAVILSISPKFAAVINVMPAGTMGGVSLILYGMIASVGIKTMIVSKVDFESQRNILISSIILILSIGINFSKNGAIMLQLGSQALSISGLSVGAITGIILNIILPGKNNNKAIEKE